MKSYKILKYKTHLIIWLIAFKFEKPKPLLLEQAEFTQTSTSISKSKRLIKDTQIRQKSVFQKIVTDSWLKGRASMRSSLVI